MRRPQPKHRRLKGNPYTYDLLDESDMWHILGVHLMSGVALGVFFAIVWISGGCR